MGPYVSQGQLNPDEILAQLLGADCRPMGYYVNGQGQLIPDDVVAQQLRGDDDDGVSGDTYWDAGIYQGPREDVVGWDDRGNEVILNSIEPYQRPEPIVRIGVDEYGNDVVVTFDPYELSLEQMPTIQLLETLGIDIGDDEFAGFLGSIVKAVTKPVASVAKAVAKPVASVAKAVAKPVTSVVKTVAKPLATVAKTAGKIALAPTTALAKVTSKIPVVGAITKTVTNVISAPTRAATQLTTGVLSGQNVAKTALQAASTLAKGGLQGAVLLGNVATFIPGLGTGVAFAIQYTASVGDAIAKGKNVLSAAKEGAIKAALNSLPGGQLTGALVTTVANIAAKGVQGQNLLKSATHELAAGAISLIPNASAQMVLQSAADAALKGQNVLTGAQAGAINAALAQIPDANARAVLDAALHLKAPTDIVKTAGPALLARAAGMVPTGGAATLVTGLTKKTPDQLAAAANTFAQTLAKSPMIKTLSSGAPVLTIPAKGVPAVAALAVTTGVAAAVHSPIPEQANAAKKLVLDTKTAADAGDKDAKLAFDAIEQASLAAKGMGALVAAQKPTPAAAPVPSAAAILQQRLAALPALPVGARRMTLAILPDATIVGQGSSAMQHLPSNAKMLTLDITTEGRISAHL